MLYEYIQMQPIAIGSSYNNSYYGYGSVYSGIPSEIDVDRIKKEILELQNTLNELIRRSNELEEALKVN